MIPHPLSLCTLCHYGGQWAWQSNMWPLTAWHGDDEALQGFLGDYVIIGRWWRADKTIEDIAVQNTAKGHLDLTGAQSQRNARS